MAELCIKGPGGFFGELGGVYMFDGLRYRPLVAERVAELAVEVSPELFFQLHGDDGASTGGCGPEVVGIWDGQGERYRGTTQGFGSFAMQLHLFGKVVGKHEVGAVDLQVRVHDAVVVRSLVAVEFDGSKRRLVEVDGGCGVADDEIGDEG